MTEAALDAVERYPHKRLTVHYMQPDSLFVSAKTDFDKHHLRQIDVDSEGATGENVWNQNSWAIYTSRGMTSGRSMSRISKTHSSTSRSFWKYSRVRLSSRAITGTTSASVRGRFTFGSTAIRAGCTTKQWFVCRGWNTSEENDVRYGPGAMKLSIILIPELSMTGYVISDTICNLNRLYLYIVDIQQHLMERIDNL
jgi:hypothetical protein